jgi:LysR family nitrogen assimilation transcriptional regulator
LARAGELTVRKLVEPTPLSVLCLINSSHRRPTPLVQRTMGLLTTLVGELPV